MMDSGVERSPNFFIYLRNSEKFFFIFFLLCECGNGELSRSSPRSVLLRRTPPAFESDYKLKCSGSLIVSHIKFLLAMLIKIKARGYNRASESFVDKWLDSADPKDAAEVKELRKKLWRYMLAEATHNRSTTFRLVQVLSEDEDDDADLIDFSSKPKKKSKKVVTDDEDDDDDE